MRKHATTYYFLFSLLAVLFWNCLLPGSVMAETKTIQETDTLEHNAMWKAQEIQLKNEDSVVTSLVSREEVQCAESREFIDRTFGGSLPGFIAAFVGNKQLSAEEADEIRRMIDGYKGD